VSSVAIRPASVSGPGGARAAFLAGGRGGLQAAEGRAVSNFVNGTEEELLTGSANLAQRLLLGYAAYGVPEAVAEALEQAQAVYASTYQTSKDPASRTKPAILAKRAAKRVLQQAIRQVFYLAEAYPGLNDEKRAQLGMTIPKPRENVSPPDVRGDVDVVELVGNDVTVRVHSAGSAMPRNVKLINAFVAVQETPPDAATQWQFQGSGTAKVQTLNLPASLPMGTTVWVIVQYANAKGESGPASIPVSVRLMGSNGLAAGFPRSARAA
jgi:hypothetical protein